MNSMTMTRESATHEKTGRGRTTRRWSRTLAVVATAGALVGLGFAGAGGASAAACSTTVGASTCSVGTSVTVTAGTVALQHSPTLYWAVNGSGYDQWASGSATALTSCAVVTRATNCSSGTAPMLMVTDSTGAAAGWALSAYVTGSNLPSGSVLTFNGAGSSTYGNSTVSPVSTSPWSATTPGNVCDFGSGCTVATAAAACSHAGLGFTTCPSLPVNLLAATTSTTQVDLYSAAATSGIGSVCFGSGTATASGCTGTTNSAFYNLGVKASAPAGTYTGAVINLTATSGP